MKTQDIQLNENQVVDFRDAGMSALDQIAREGARRMLEVALEAEVEAYINEHCKVVDGQGHRMVVRNGYARSREVATGAGMLKVNTPRVDDRREGYKFTSAILPPYMRKSPSLEKLIPCLYLKGISTGQFQNALEAILGKDAPGLSASSICSMIKGWEEEFREWSERDLSGKKYIYFWADAVYLNVRLGDDDKVCLLVIMGVNEDGHKELVGISGGYRESKLSWQDLLRSLKDRGLSESPKLAIGDGALGFWSALAEEYPDCTWQRCWVHKTANILDKMPKKTQERAKKAIHNIYLAETKREALEAYDQFTADYEAKYPKACECLKKDKEHLFAFFDFPAMHWQSIRTSNPIESTFSTVRHRTKRTKGHGSRNAAVAMAFKLCLEAEKHWRRLRGFASIIYVFDGRQFKDGILVEEQEEPQALRA